MKVDSPCSIRVGSVGHHSAGQSSVSPDPGGVASRPRPLGARSSPAVAPWGPRSIASPSPPLGTLSALGGGQRRARCRAAVMVAPTTTARGTPTRHERPGALVPRAGTSSWTVGGRSPRASRSRWPAHPGGSPADVGVLFVDLGDGDAVHGRAVRAHRRRPRPRALTGLAALAVPRPWRRCRCRPRCRCRRQPGLGPGGLIPTRLGDVELFIGELGERRPQGPRPDPGGCGQRPTLANEMANDHTGRHSMTSASRTPYYRQPHRRHLAVFSSPPAR